MGPRVYRRLLDPLLHFHHVESLVDFYRGDELNYEPRHMFDCFWYCRHGGLVRLLFASDIGEDVLAFSRLYVVTSIRDVSQLANHLFQHL